MLEIGLRVGAKKHAQKSSYQLFAVKLEEGPGRRVTLPGSARCCPAPEGRLRQEGTSELAAHSQGN